MFDLVFCREYESQCFFLCFVLEKVSFAFLVAAEEKTEQLMKHVGRDHLSNDCSGILISTPFCPKRLQETAIAEPRVEQGYGDKFCKSGCDCT